MPDQGASSIRGLREGLAAVAVLLVLVPGGPEPQE